MVWVRWHCRTPHLWCIKYHTITLTSCKASRLLVACERWHGGNWQINVATSGICNILIAIYTYISFIIWPYDTICIYIQEKRAQFLDKFGKLFLGAGGRPQPPARRRPTWRRKKEHPGSVVQKIWAAQTVDKRWSRRMSKTTSSFHTKYLGAIFNLLSAYWLVCLLCVSLEKKHRSFT